MRRFFVLTGIVLAMLSQLGCSQDEELAQSEHSMAGDAMDAFNAAPFVGNVALEDMSEGEAMNLSVKTPLEIITVLEGTTKVKLQARFRHVEDSLFGFPLYECELIDEGIEIAAGMSGSPVGPPGRVMGALAYGYKFNKPPYRFLVTSIEAMEATIEHLTFGEFLEQPAAPAAPGIGVHATYVPMKMPLTVTGIQPHRLQEIASHLSGSQFDFVELYAHPGGAPAAPPAGVSSKLFAGDMIGVAVATGDIVNAIAFGTVTQVYGDKFVAFGHPMTYSGQAALPVYRAVVDGIVRGVDSSFKSTYAIGKPIGTITKDLRPAIVGELGVGPAMIPVTITYLPVNSEAIETHHVVAYGQEQWLSLVAGITVDALRMEGSQGTVEASVTLHFQETDSVYTESFRVTSTVPFLDVYLNTDTIIQSFTEQMQNSAGKATLKAVSMAISDKPQIAEAEIAEVSTPPEVVPGETLPVTIVLVPHWSTAKNGRTIEREILLDIPVDFPAGEAILEVSDASSSDSFGTFDEIFDALGVPLPDNLFDDDDDEEPVPMTLDELIQQKSEDQEDPGLITVTLTSKAAGGDFLGLDLPEFGGLPEDLAEPADFLPEAPEPTTEVEAELIIDGFIVTGTKEVQITILPGGVNAE